MPGVTLTVTSSLSGGHANCWSDIVAKEESLFARKSYEHNSSHFLLLASPVPRLSCEVFFINLPTVRLLAAELIVCGRPVDRLLSWSCVEREVIVRSESRVYIP